MQEQQVSQELLAILVCPETKQAVSLASDSVLASLNAKIATGAVKNKAGKPVSEKLKSGLLTADAMVIYPIIDGIPIMLVEEGILISES